MKLLIGWLFLWVGVGAWAFGAAPFVPGPPVTEYYMLVNGSEVIGAQAACDATGAYERVQHGWGPVSAIVNAASTYCSIVSAANPGAGNLYGSGISSRQKATQICSSNAFKVGAGCICGAGYGATGTGGACQPTVCGPAGSHDSITRPDVEVTVADTNQCVAGCQVVANKVSLGVDGRMWASWPFVSKGSSAFCGGPTKDDVTRVATPTEASGKSVGSDAPVPCAKGMCPGVINSASVCVACGGLTTSRDNLTGEAGAGSRDVTTCRGDACTVTHYDGSGAQTGTEIGSGTKQGIGEGTDAGYGAGGSPSDSNSFCSENPTSPICKTSSIGGSCAAVSCDGDAIQCAIAREQQKRNCEFFNENEASIRGMAAANAGDTPPDHPRLNATEVQIGLPGGGFDMTDIIGVGGCPADVAIPMPGGRQMTLAVSKLCGPAAMLGNILVGVTALACLGIALKGN